ncbi:hypothetical protein BHE74_00042440 [Ensete ventricosum]|uniref:Uncharacterized protein n=1 Tax=Ensete ventricosum TaxID=4639 RepID=A0A426XKH0_ENSVE|nr:hypothetical protein B296_00058805 [Ensete ventricosum]RWW51230.1 hypothetical protein BHE74_00042440 [Ensete ventricosum]RZS15906.1 hypothetical protein BHM03_00047813 [Ensete ventricosum]
MAWDNVMLLWKPKGRHPTRHGTCKPGTITPHTKFVAIVYVLKIEDGGRQ